MKISRPVFITIAASVALLSACSDAERSVDAGSPLDAGLDGGAPADAGLVNPLLPPMPLGTAGRWVVDANGKRVKLSGYNWNGGEGPEYVMSGLDTQDRRDIARSLREYGFNAIRLVWSNELVEKNPVVADAKLEGNPDLKGKTALEVMDAVVAALAAEGVMVIMNNHISDAIWCCSSTDDNLLWYNQRYPERKWLADWRLIAGRYRNEPAVIGADLRNEPRVLATWGDSAGADFDWAAAAERGGNAVLEIAPHWLVFVEGTNFAGNLRLAGERPIKLNLPGRVVYSVHDYSWFHPSAKSAEDIKALWKIQWSYLLEQDKPVWMGELGTCAACIKNGTFDQVWFETNRAFLIENDLDWSWWMLHGDCNGNGWGMFDRNTGKPCSEELLKLHQEQAKPTKDSGIARSN
jgi:endoglucanase